ncbi:met-10+ like-protein [Nitzschia inconspicua]|uniref:Met-10+ like-protein n=1 Tax=Nitzschia inconspicua TaxID=303405 RepID=A0A9K3KKU8_9STRA|nr:met-10+ like-protein [Nitzschia inconspicua]
MNAKTVKNLLDDRHILNKDFRMVPAVSATLDGTTYTTSIDVPSTKMEEYDQIENLSWIAIPVIQTNTDGSQSFTSIPLVEAMGYHWCPYSTKILGNNQPKVSVSTKNHSLGTVDDPLDKLSLTQLIVLNLEESRKRGISISKEYSSLVETVQKLDVAICPQRLERFGDDQTLVIPPLAFAGDEFCSLLRNVWKVVQHETLNNSPPTDVDNTRSQEIQQDFWLRLARAHSSPRIVRRGVIDPKSKIRQSGHRLVWPSAGIPTTTGPGSPGWICVTEQGIHQSFDMTRVMFCRGNISEKIRFGKLVKEGEVVVDLYAGIGYYTLPALVHGKASFVYACEWNEHAASALKINVVDNKVSSRVQVLVGDCRKLALNNHLVNIADRVSLGLLPSSEGGWRTAIRALKSDTGGWLHVHGNVPVTEKTSWALWVCAQLFNIVQEERKEDDWVVVCNHVERVKSFAPTVCHYVADIFAGREELCGVHIPDQARVGIIRQDSTFVACPEVVEPPSCALSPDGVLCHEWMR